MPQNIIQLADEFRRAVLRNERKAAIRMITAYDVILGRLSKRIADLNQKIAEAKARGEIVNPSWLLRERRYAELLAQVDREMTRFSNLAEDQITNQQKFAANAGLRDSAELVATAAESANLAVTFNKLPTAAVENLVGTLSNGSPLRVLLDQLPRDARRIVEQGLIESVALGVNPRQIASKIKAGLGGNLNRALTISRTETLRAYRTASIQNYQANSDVVRGWYWRSARSRRSCAACIALDGTFWPVNQPMRPHPRCRCTLIPAVRGVSVDKGTSWFNKQDFETQREIMGTDSGLEAIKSGELNIKDFVGLSRNPLWGESYYQLSVKRAKAGEGRFPK